MMGDVKYPGDLHMNILDLLHIMLWQPTKNIHSWWSSIIHLQNDKKICAFTRSKNKLQNLFIYCFIHL